jgi:ketosteroid isomerase-like protein
MRPGIVVLCLLGAALVAGSQAAAAGQSGRPAPDALAVRIQTLEDREAIRALLVAYASTLDNRDFAGFELLWAKDAEFLGGAGNTAKGPAAIRDLLRGLLTKNGSPAPGRDFHLVMNQTVDVTGDTATGFSRGTWVSTNAENRLQVTIIANYYDQFVREGGRWKFKRHQIGGTPPAAAGSR